MIWILIIVLIYILFFRLLQFIGQHSDIEQHLEDEYQIQFLKEKKRKKEQKINDHLHFLRHGYIKRN
ncbi:hypothetical protein [Geotoga petraea]|jgi:hypothetical protein|uniref:Uncharacterized protein n=1 Tax=Geotoga petraea TaxID=28234 RepID=A0A1G6LQX7_9BACT|nr:hypothetical protein [Geotoga petraea]SDC45599.1 hypothetical protein SAMN04488588_1115 [Geotoga petraea]